MKKTQIFNLAIIVLLLIYSCSSSDDSNDETINEIEHNCDEGVLKNARIGEWFAVKECVDDICNNEPTTYKSIEFCKSGYVHMIYVDGSEKTVKNTKFGNSSPAFVDGDDITYYLVHNESDYHHLIITIFAHINEGIENDKSYYFNRIEPNPLFTGEWELTKKCIEDDCKNKEDITISDSFTNSYLKFNIDGTVIKRDIDNNETTNTYLYTPASSGNRLKFTRLHFPDINNAFENKPSSNTFFNVEISEDELVYEFNSAPFFETPIYNKFYYRKVN